ncbi:MAG: phospholipase D-like domain-containing protein [bacterium]|nr:phospholipase D-like domain-containing protein [bacterium]
MSVADRINRFLAEHPGVPLTVAVGFASPAGIAWLARRTRNRPVRLLIGDCKPQRFERSSREDRDEMLRFLARSDVKVRNWYSRQGTGGQGKGPDAHLKVWVAHDSPRPAALNGSANLSKQGLYHNVEVVTAVPDSETRAVVQVVEDLFNKGWDVKDRLRGYMDSSTYSKSSSTSTVSRRNTRRRNVPRRSTRRRNVPRRSTRRRPVRRRRSRKKGCAPVGVGCLTLVVAYVAVSVLVGLLGQGCESGFETFSPAPTQATFPTTPTAPTTEAVATFRQTLSSG